MQNISFDEFLSKILNYVYTTGKLTIGCIDEDGNPIESYEVPVKRENDKVFLEDAKLHKMWVEKVLASIVNSDKTGIVVSSDLGIKDGKPVLEIRVYRAERKGNAFIIKSVPKEELQERAVLLDGIAVYADEYERRQ
jgi:predicted molibdopterin-dependent oxidoreductase YjgC